MASLNAPAAGAEAAAHNNATWCSAVCAAHGDGGEWTAPAWRRRTPAPPYYPNLVTLQAHPEPAALAALLQALPRGACAVKDSFARLDLHRHGFKLLFEARWLWRELGTPLPPAAALDWRVVDHPEALRAWEAAWWREAEPADPGRHARLFPDALLQQRHLHFVAGHDGTRVRAGGVWSRSQAPGAGPVLGLACCFGAAADEPSVPAGLVRAAERWCPGLPQVGYESGAAELQAQACGFRPVGPLRVWLRALADG